MAIKTVSIVGVGLIGGSFALALRKQGFRGRILGVSSPRTVDAALRLGVIDEALPLGEAVGAADLIYLAQPISRIVEVLPEVRAAARPESLTTDAGSTKAVIAARAAEVFGDGPWFVGGHPMAGKEARGVEQADGEIFRHSTYVLTPPGGKAPETPHYGELVRWIGRIGAHVVEIEPGLHDRIVARTSHLPQLLSTALACAVGRESLHAESLRISGGGLRDMTRLAQSPFEIWRDILATNNENIGIALEELIEVLSGVREELRGDDMEKRFEQAEAVARKILGR